MSSGLPCYEVPRRSCGAVEQGRFEREGESSVAVPAVQFEEGGEAVNPPPMDVALQRAGLAMTYADAMFHVEQGGRVVRAAWTSWGRRDRLTPEDKLAEDWVVL